VSAGARTTSGETRQLSSARWKQGCGGFIGYDPGDVWLGGTGPGYPRIVRLLDSGKWEHVTISFKGPKSIRLKIEDFSGSGGKAGDAFFDNIRLMTR